MQTDRLTVSASVKVLAAWGAVHATRRGAETLGFAGAFSVLMANVSIEQLGPVGVATPISMLLLLPVVAGVAVGVALSNESDGLGLPDPARAAVARAAWFIAWTGVAASVTALAGFINDGVEPGAIVRNVVLYAALAAAAPLLRVPHLAWLLPIAYALVCVMFGYPPGQPGYYWWAVVMEPEASPAHLVAVTGCAAVALACYTSRWPARMRQE